MALVGIKHSRIIEVLNLAYCRGKADKEAKEKE